MDNNIPTYVMHYTPNTRRKHVLSKILEKENFSNVEWITDYDRETITEDDVKNNFNSNFCNIRNKCFSSPEEKSLSLKHLEALKNLVSSEYEYALFLEDDAILEENFLNKFFFYFDKKPINFEMGYINYGYPEDRIEDPNKQYWFRKYWPKVSKFSDAIVFSKSAAKKILTSITNNKICLPIDHEYNYWIRENNINAYWLEPPITAQGSQLGLYESFQIPYGSAYVSNSVTLNQLRSDLDEILK